MGLAMGCRYITALFGFDANQTHVGVPESGEQNLLKMKDDLLGTSPVYREIYEHGLLERRFADAVEARAAFEEVA